MAAAFAVNDGMRHSINAPSVEVAQIYTGKVQQPPLFSADHASTQRRTAALDEYFSAHVQHGGKFYCNSEAACRSSHSGPFYPGQLHHVGTHYDLRKNGLILRIVIVGQEYGHADSLVSLERRHDMIALQSGLSSRFISTPGFTARNPHMRGCTSARRMLLGAGAASDHEGEFLEIGGTKIHIFECFALVNFLLCSALTEEAETFSEMGRPGGRPGRSSNTMQRNCARHFRQAMEILEPTLLNAQGKGVRQWLRQALHLGRLPPASLVEKVEVGKREAVLVSLTHPSARAPFNWGQNARTPYLLTTVRPALETAIEMLSSKL